MLIYEQQKDSIKIKLYVLMYFNKYLLNNFYAPGSIVSAEEVLWPWLSQNLHSIGVRHNK